MVHIAAIRTALDRNETAALERAFRVLAEFPQAGFIDGADSIDVLTETLDRVVARLSNDRAMMPSRTFAAIVRAKPNTLAEGASYAEGARVVAAHRQHWHAVFLMHVAPEPCDGPRLDHDRSGQSPASVTVALPRTLARGLDAFIAAQPEAGLSRPEATRIILRHTLAKLGHLGTGEEQVTDGPDASGDR